MDKSIQETYAPRLRCFGCGPANDQGLGLRSFRAAGAEEIYVAKWRPQPHHEAYEGVLNGGIIGTLLDCHSDWAAAMHLMRKRGADTPPVCVTAEYHVKLTRPTPTDTELTLFATIAESTQKRAVVEARLEAAGEICATCRGTFVAVPAGHPAGHGW